MEIYYQDPSAATSIANALAKGQCILSPTDTIYGLGCDGLNHEAVERIRQLKGRSADKPFILLASSLSFVNTHFHCEGIREQLVALWPGPFSVLLRPKTKFLLEIAPDSGKIAVRIPKDPLFQNVFKLWGGLMLSTSANQSGHPYEHSWENLKKTFSEGLDLWVKKDPYPPAKPSCLLDVEEGQWTILREGEIPLPFPIEKLASS